MNDRFGSTARDFAAGIVTREGGTPEDVRELSYGPDLDRIVSDHRAEFDWNTVPGMGARVRDWYAEQFPDDPLGGMIASDVTFAQTVESLHGAMSTTAWASASPSSANACSPSCPPESDADTTTYTTRG